MFIYLDGRELAVVDNLSETAIANIIPYGVQRVTSRSPRFDTVMRNYCTLLEAEVQVGTLNLDSPEVSAYFAVKRAVSQGILVEVRR